MFVFDQNLTDKQHRSVVLDSWLLSIWYLDLKLFLNLAELRNGNNVYRPLCIQLLYWLLFTETLVCIILLLI